MNNPRTGDRPGRFSIDIDKFLNNLDDATELLDAVHALHSLVNEQLDHPATATELSNALNTIIAVNVIAARIREDRDPAYWEEEYYGE